MSGSASVEHGKYDHNGSGSSTPPTYATLWHVNAATLGLIATCAVLVRRANILVCNC